MTDELQARAARLAEYDEQYPAKTWTGHDRPALGMWRGQQNLEHDKRVMGQLVAIRESYGGMVLVTFEDGTRLALTHLTQFRLSPLSRGVSLDVARRLLDAVAQDSPEVLGEQLTALRREMEKDEAMEQLQGGVEPAWSGPHKQQPCPVEPVEPVQSWLSSGGAASTRAVPVSQLPPDAVLRRQLPHDGIGADLAPILSRLARMRQVPDVEPEGEIARRLAALLRTVADDVEQLIGEVQVRRGEDVNRRQRISVEMALAARKTGPCDHPDGAGTRCGACGQDVAAVAGARMRPDALERAARWLWRNDAGSDSAWPFAGDLRRPFYEQAGALVEELTEDGTPAAEPACG